MFDWLIVGGIVISGYYVIKALNDITGKDFEAYKIQYPELVKNGTVTCCKCGSNSIALLRDREGNLILNQIMVHQCRTCGCRLYFSKN